MFSRVTYFRNQIFPGKLILRTFLSNEFKCNNEWQARLNAPFMQKIKLEKFYYDIEQSFNTIGKASAIDIDLFVNKFNPEDEHHISEIIGLLQKFRLTEETTNIFDSTHHAVIRNFIETEHSNDLLNILDNRLEYGIFLDDYSGIYLLDYLIKQKNFLGAAKVSSQFMLQEDFSNELLKSLALFGCYKYLEKPEPFFIQEKDEQDPNEKKEEIKVRVKFIRNEFFDDHFDLRNQYHIVGKTLLEISKNLNTDFKISVEFMGNLYYEKYLKCIEILKKNPNQLHKDVIEKCSVHLEKIFEENKEALMVNEEYNNVKSLISNILNEEQYKDTNLYNILEDFVKETVTKFEQTEIQKQKLLYEEWNKNREIKLHQEIERLNRVKRIQEVERLTKEMEVEEQKLWFFENEDKIDLQIDSKKVTYPKRWFGKKKKPRVIDEDYIPPEIVKNRS